MNLCTGCLCLVSIYHDYFSIISHFSSSVYMMDVCQKRKLYDTYSYVHYHVSYVSVTFLFRQELACFID